MNVNRIEENLSKAYKQKIKKLFVTKENSYSDNSNLEADELNRNGRGEIR